MAVELSPAAVQRVKEIQVEQSLPEAFLRMGVKGGGCSGLSYNLEFDTEKGKHDKLFEVDGVKVVVDLKSYLYLNGSTLDYVKQGLTGGFTFINPKAKSSCGCGSSFTA
jgi:iron-sulfur cluster assembly protein